MFGRRQRPRSLGRMDPRAHAVPRGTRRTRNRGSRRHGLPHVCFRMSATPQFHVERVPPDRRSPLLRTVGRRRGSIRNTFHVEHGEPTHTSDLRPGSPHVRFRMSATPHVPRGTLPRHTSTLLHAHGRTTTGPVSQRSTWNTDSSANSTDIGPDDLTPVAAGRHGPTFHVERSDRGRRYMALRYVVPRGTPWYPSAVSVCAHPSSPQGGDRMFHVELLQAAPGGTRTRSAGCSTWNASCRRNRQGYIGPGQDGSERSPGDRVWADRGLTTTAGCLSPGEIRRRSPVVTTRLSPVSTCSMGNIVACQCVDCLPSSRPCPPRARYRPLVVGRTVLRGTSGRAPPTPTDPTDPTVVITAAYGHVSHRSGHSASDIERWTCQVPSPGGATHGHLCSTWNHELLHTHRARRSMAADDRGGDAPAAQTTR